MFTTRFLDFPPLSSAAGTVRLPGSKSISNRVLLLPIDSDWKRRVRDRMEQLRISQNELARQAKISKAALSQALSDDSLQSAFVPEIHKALGWRVPPLVLSPDALELQALYDQMDEFDRGAFVERARAKVEEKKRGRRN